MASVVEVSNIKTYSPKTISWLAKYIHHRKGSEESWKFDDDSSLDFEWTVGKIVPQELMIYCVMILLFAKMHMIVMITTEADTVIYVFYQLLG